VAAESGRFAVVVDHAGEYAIRLRFDAAVRPANGWNEIDFGVAPTPLQSIVLRGLPADAQVEFAGGANRYGPARISLSTLPSNGRVKLSWKTAKAEARQVVSSRRSHSRRWWSARPDAQTALLDFRVMQASSARGAGAQGRRGK